MRFLTSVPIVFAKGLQVWLGLMLLGLSAFQIFTGIRLFRGRSSLIRYHKFNGLFLMIPIGFLHVYYGVGIWFFGFKYF